jgi:GNAT superfamily N-acetyltransferase
VAYNRKHGYKYPRGQVIVATFATSLAAALSLGPATVIKKLSIYIRRPMAPTDEYRVEKATVEDIPIIESTVHAAYSKYIERIGMAPAPMLADYKEVIKNQDVYVLRTTCNDKVIGSISLTVNDGEQSIMVNNLVVDPSAQGRGYGRVLMDHAERLAQSLGHRKMILFTNVKMYENIGLYTKLGFTETDRRKEGPYERLYFLKELK